MTHDQILAVERKIRVKTSLTLHGKVLKLNDSPLPIDGSADIIYDSIELDFSCFNDFDEVDKENAVYFGEYISKKLKKELSLFWLSRIFRFFTR